MRLKLLLAVAWFVGCQAQPIRDEGPRIELSARDVAFELDERQLSESISLLAWSPKILYPTAGVVWRAGQQANITWNATLPGTVGIDQVSNNGTLLLGTKNATAESYLHLDVNDPLGVNIPLYTGDNTFSFTLPDDLDTKDNYVLVLMGSSGNASPTFTILAQDASALPSSSSASIRLYTQTFSTPSSTAAVPSSTATSGSGGIPAASAVATSGSTLNKQSSGTVATHAHSTGTLALTVAACLLVLIA